MAKIDLSKYGITGTTEIVYNPSYEVLFEEETKPELEGFEKGQVSELGAVNVMTGIYTEQPWLLWWLQFLCTDISSGKDYAGERS